ncbi:DUF4383 domain-containing protein [Amycolatopsis orientalis]|uniref:DUF4383 domain-containing protein n=1 Tax=Amycolatopsis orientalis TaxID=31958 RepID=UPI0004181384|nr:DUF4383 domain-containing protein [Amycolatopsis orientalis]
MDPAAILAYCWIVFVAFAGLTAFGVLSAATDSAGDAVNFGWADNVLHALTSLAAVTVALLVTRRTRRTRVRA